VTLPPDSKARRFLRNPLVGNVLALYAIQGLNYLLPLALLPYLLRVLGAQSYGALVLSQALMGYAVVLTDFGFNFTAARDVSIARGDPKAVAQIYWTTVAAKGLLLAVAMLVLIVVVLAVPSFRIQWPIFMASSLMVFGNAIFPQWYLQGLERLKDAALIQSIAKIVLAAATFALVHSPADVWLAAALAGAPHLLGVAAAIVLRRPLYPDQFYRPGRADVLRALHGSWHMFASGIATTLYGNTNTVVLGLMAGEKAVAMFSLAQRLISALQSMAMPMTQAVFPRASLLFATDPNKAWILMRRVVTLILPSVGMASVVVALFAPELVALVGGTHYAAAATDLRIMAVVPVIIAAGALPAQIIIVARGLTARLLRIYVWVGLGNLVLLPMLVLQYSDQGAAMSLMAAEVVVTVLMVRLACRRDRSDDKTSPPPGAAP